MIGREPLEIEIREGDRFYGFYSRETGKWISGCRKPYLFDVMVELQNRTMDLQRREVYFVLEGNYENDASVLKRLRNDPEGGRFAD